MESYGLFDLWTGAAKLSSETSGKFGSEEIASAMVVVDKGDDEPFETVAPPAEDPESELLQS